MRLNAEVTSEAFARLSQAGRGDSARGRNLQALFLLELCWADQRLPLASYRPRRNPAAFLAMVFDLLGEFRREAGVPVVDEPSRDALSVTLEQFFTDLSRDTPRLAEELRPLLYEALLDPKRSTLPRFLERLPLYLTTEELAKVDRARVIAALPLAEVFAHLGYHPPEPGPGSERHPMGRDLRKALRAELDAAWARAMAGVAPSAVAFTACFPLNLTQLAVRLPTPLPDFVFFYALVTDGASPGRRWRPPAVMLGDEAARPHFEALVRDPSTRQARLGLSSTLPRTVARLDAWLEQEPGVAKPYASHAWRAWLHEHESEIELTRLQFLARLGEAL